MSLLDQLSSLCVPAAGYEQYFNFTQIHSSKTQDQNVFSLKAKYNELINFDTQVIIKTSEIPNNKLIRLFDDNQVNGVWSLQKMNKQSKKDVQIYNIASSANNQNVFHVGNYQKNNKGSFKIFTKISYLIKNKVRKLNYQFFVKLEQYCKQVKKQQEANQIKLQAQKIKLLQSGVQKLSETVRIINLKYVQSNQAGNQQIQSLRIKQTIQNAFYMIKSIFQRFKQLQLLQKIHRKLYLHKFVNQLKLFNKKVIKIQLFDNIISSIVKKKQKYIFSSIFKFLSKLQTGIIISFDKNSEDLSNQDKKEQNQLVQLFKRNISQQKINLSCKSPLKYTQHKAGVKKCSQLMFKSIQFSFRQEKCQNIPLKLHSLKTHQQQINLNDCLDNGHLLMNIIRSNNSFKDELQNLTISKINSNNNSSFNSSALTYQNLILNQFNIDAQNNTNIQQKALTMRKSLKTQQKLTKQIKKPRASLIIIKRKQSLGNPITLYDQQKNSINNNKMKSSNPSKANISNNKKQNEKQIIKKMIEQLNKKFQTQDKTLSINVSNKKQQTNKKQTLCYISNNNSNVSNNICQRTQNNFDRKKSHSQLANHPVLISYKQKFQTKQQQKLTSNQKDCKISLISNLKLSKDTCQNPKRKMIKQRQKKQQNCFMSVTLNQSSYSNCNNKKQNANYNQSANKIMNARRKPEKYFKIDFTIGKNQHGISGQAQNDLYLEYPRRVKIYENEKLHTDDQTIQNQHLIKSNINLPINCQNRSYKMTSNQPQNSIDQKLLKNIWQPSQQRLSGLNKRKTKQIAQNPFNINQNENMTISSNADSALGGFISILPSSIFIPQDQQDTDTDFKYYKQKKPASLSQIFDNVGQKLTYSCYPSSNPLDQKTIRQSLSKNINLLQKNQNSLQTNKKSQQSRQLWDSRFQKQKTKLSDNKQIKRWEKHIKDIKTQKKRVSCLSASIIKKIKMKIQQSIILSQKDMNSIHPLMHQSIGKYSSVPAQLILKLYNKSSNQSCHISSNESYHNSQVKINKQNNHESNFISLAKSHVFK